jgi:hypothetical protein
MLRVKIPADYVVIFDSDEVNDEQAVVLKHKNYALFGRVIFDHPVHLAKSLKETLASMEKAVKEGKYPDGPEPWGGKPLLRD